MTDQLIATCRTLPESAASAFFQAGPTTGQFCYCVDNANTSDHDFFMADTATTAETNIHLRARPQDRRLIDQAAELIGTNRSQFMMASALKEAKNVLLDQSTIYADARTFQRVMDWIDAEPTPAEADGMRRILQAKAPWQGD